MARLILKCPYLKGGGESVSAHLGNLVKYIATRDGVEKMDNTTKNLPTTEKQQKLMKQILKESPRCKNLFEYEDYIESGTRENASEFISMALEQNLDKIGKRKNYVDYIANRPRVAKLGSHGLFTGSDDALVLSHIADEVSNHTGNVWTPIISLRRGDAERLGYDSAENWQALLSSYTIEMADSLKIHPDHLRWYAAFHNESHHPHIHMICYSTDPKEGYLTKKGIEKMKSGLVQKIFGDELKEIYMEQTKRRDFLNKKSREVMKQLILQMRKGTLQNNKIEQLTAHLADRLRFTSGKKQYGYLKAPLKTVVDEIVDELAKDSRVADAYQLWYEMRNEVLHSYMDILPELMPLSKQKEFKAIRNMVIKEVVSINNMNFRFEEVPQVDDESAEPENIVEDEIIENVNVFIFQDDISGESPEDETSPHVVWSDEYKQARAFLSGGKGIKQDLVKAFELFFAEAKKGNALAMYDLGRMFADGLGREIDMEQSYWWYAKALSSFLSMENENAWKYIEYRIGKIFAGGLGTEQDDTTAAEWFWKSAEQKYKFAQYSLGGLYYRGQGVEQNHEKAFALYKQSASQGFPYASFEVGKMLRDGIGTAKNDAESDKHFQDAFIGFEALEKQGGDDKIQYRLGWMLQSGIGTEKDVARAMDYFEKSAQLGNSVASYSLAKLILAEENSTDVEIQKAVEYLSQASGNENQFVQYALGKLYLDAKYVEKDIFNAIQLFTLSAEQGNEYAAYQLGKLYLKGEETPKDILSAIKWLSISAEKGNMYAQFFLDNINKFQNPSVSLIATRMLHHMSKIFEDTISLNPSATGLQIDSKLKRKMREKKMAQGHAKDDHEQKM